ncbi:hypothetical protein GALL_549370 [mine drainage metagenome]|uniref:Uncharacterized protein n=1 Tax=mine drainage metagenome TaxID=410659 RepID=A0A1J5PE59_9ZZZZ
MSGAPICSGIIQFASPVSAGITDMKIMIRPCMVPKALNSSGLSSHTFGFQSSVRMANASTPPTNNITRA